MSLSYTQTAVLDGQLYCLLVQGGAASLRASAQEVNSLNVFPVPDGDTGDNMSMTAEGGVTAVATMSGVSDTSGENIVSGISLGEAAKNIADGMLLGARGNSGVILSQFFSGVARGFANLESANVRELAAALEAGVAQAYGAVLSPAEGTILTVCREGVAYAVSRVTDESTVRSVFADMKDEMYRSLQRTPELLPVLKEAGVIDSGGAGLYYIIEGMLRVLDGESIESAVNAAAPSGGTAISFDAFTEDSEMEYGYCTECLLRLQTKKCDVENFDVETVSSFLCSVGNSVVCFKNGSVVKLHVHTMTPEKVLEFCRTFGEFLTVKIENMSVQHSENAGQSEQTYHEGSLSAISHTNGSPAQSTSQDACAHKAVGTACVCSGEGIAAAFRELGADRIIDGGQTSNPSAGDFIEAFKKIDADVILVLPNNSNIILAAKQAAEMYKAAEIRVIESKDIGMGYVALSAMDLLEETDADALIASAEEAMAGVATGMLSTSVRDANINGVAIKEGEYIGFIGKQMVTSKPSLADAAKELIDTLLGEDDKYLLTAFRGKGLGDGDADAIGAYIAERYADVEYYCLDGGQDVYPLILVAE